MLSDQYYAAAVSNVTESLDKVGIILPSKYVTPVTNGYKTGVDVTSEIKSDELQYYNHLIRVLQCEIEIGRLYTSLEMF